MKKQQRELHKTNKELERDRGGLERQERQLVSRVRCVCVCVCEIVLR